MVTQGSQQNATRWGWRFCFSQRAKQGRFGFSTLVREEADRLLCSTDSGHASAAADGGDVLHGLRRSLRNRRHPRRGLPEGADHPAGAAVAVEPAHGADDRRAGERAAGRGRLLRLGAARDGAFLGLPGGVAFADGQYLRHGPLTDTVRAVSWAAVSRVDRGLAWSGVGAGADRAVLRVEPAGRT